MRNTMRRIVVGTSALCLLMTAPMAATAAPGADDGSLAAPDDVATADGQVSGAVEDVAPADGTAEAGGSAPSDLAEGDEVMPGTGDEAVESGSPAPAAQRAALTTIPQIQVVGEGDDSALTGSTVTTLGVVTGTHPKGEDGLASTLDGFTIQTPGTGGPWDSSRASSDGLFVYVGKNVDLMPEIGQCVQVTGKVGEYPATSGTNPAAVQSLTQLTAKTVTRVQGCEPVTATPLGSVPSSTQMEALESMLIAPEGTWTITDNYQVNQYGTLSLTPGTEPLRAATDVVAPGEAAVAYEAANAAKAISLDDGTNTNLLRGTATSVPYAYIANGSPARVGYHVEFTQPVLLDVRHSAFVFQPTRMVAAHPDRSPVRITGERPEAPVVKGDIKVATFNVLNYFSDLGQDEPGCKGYPDREGNFVTAKDCKVRGAWSRKAFEQQQAKIVRAINTINADIVALEEIENPVGVGIGQDRDGALKTLVDALNADAGSEVWGYVPSPSTVPAKEDVIRVAFIYHRASITPVGESKILDDPAFTGLARQPLAQEFAPIVAPNQQGTNVVVIANHFKSKGSVPSGMEAGNTDTGDGQGNSNGIRVAQARALASFAAQFDAVPTLLVGDFNAYSMEDPLAVLKNAGWIHQSAGSHSSYVYQGRSGSLDHVFSNAAAAPYVVEVASWSLNAEESVAFEYSRGNANAHLMTETDNPYRSSDHNPEIVGLALITAAPEPQPNPEPNPQPNPVVPPSSGQVNSPSATTTGGKASTLARTGADGLPATVAGVLLLAGLALVASTRRAR